MVNIIAKKHIDAIVPDKVDYFPGLIGATYDTDEFHTALGNLRYNIDFPETATLTYNIENPPKMGEPANGKIKPAMYEEEEVLVLRKKTSYHPNIVLEKKAYIYEFVKANRRREKIIKLLDEDPTNPDLHNEYVHITNTQLPQLRNNALLCDYFLIKNQISTDPDSPENGARAERVAELKARLEKAHIVFSENHSEEVIGVYRVSVEAPIRLTASQLKELRELYGHWVKKLEDLSEQATKGTSQQLEDDIRLAASKVKRYYNKMVEQDYLKAWAVWKSRKAKPEDKKRAGEIIDSALKILKPGITPEELKDKKEKDEITEVTVYGILPRYMFENENDKGMHAAIAYFLGVTAERYVSYIHTFYEVSEEEDALGGRSAHQTAKEILARIMPNRAELEAERPDLYENMRELSEHIANVVLAVAEPYRADNKKIIAVTQDMFKSRKREMEGKVKIISLTDYLIDYYKRHYLEGDEDEIHSNDVVDFLLTKEGMEYQREGSKEELLRQKLKQWMLDRGHEVNSIHLERSIVVGRAKIYQKELKQIFEDYEIYSIAKDSIVTKDGTTLRWNVKKTPDVTLTALVADNRNMMVVNGPNEEMELTLRMLLLSSQVILHDYEYLKLQKKINEIIAKLENTGAEHKYLDTTTKITKKVDGLAPTHSDQVAEITRLKELVGQMKQYEQLKTSAMDECGMISQIMITSSLYQNNTANAVQLSAVHATEFKARGDEIHGEMSKAASVFMGKLENRPKIAAKHLNKSRIDKISRCRRFVCVAERRAKEVLGNDVVIFEKAIDDFSKTARQLLNTSAGHGKRSLEAYNSYRAAKKKLLMILETNNDHLLESSMSKKEAEKAFRDSFSALSKVVRNKIDPLRRPYYDKQLIEDHNNARGIFFQEVATADDEIRKSKDRGKLTAQLKKVYDDLARNLSEIANALEVTKLNKHETYAKIAEEYKEAKNTVSNIVRNYRQTKQNPLVSVADHVKQIGRTHYFERTLSSWCKKAGNKIHRGGIDLSIFKKDKLPEAENLSVTMQRWGRKLGKTIDEGLHEITGGKHIHSPIMPSRRLIPGAESTPITVTSPKTRYDINNEVVNALIDGVDALVRTKRRSDKAINNISKNFKIKMDSLEEQYFLLNVASQFPEAAELALAR